MSAMAKKKKIRYLTSLASVPSSITANRIRGATVTGLPMALLLLQSHQKPTSEHIYHHVLFQRPGLHCTPTHCCTMMLTSSVELEFSIWVFKCPDRQRCCLTWPWRGGGGRDSPMRSTLIILPLLIISFPTLPNSGSCSVWFLLIRRQEFVSFSEIIQLRMHRSVHED